MNNEEGKRRIIHFRDLSLSLKIAIFGGYVYSIFIGFLALLFAVNFVNGMIG